MHMNSPEKDMISYDRIRNREKLGSAKYWILGALILAVLVYAAFFPIPTRVSRTLQAFRYDGGDLTAGTPCTVEIDGRVNRYLFRDNEFKGRIAFSTDERTCRADADADTILQRGKVMGRCSISSARSCWTFTCRAISSRRRISTGSTRA